MRGGSRLLLALAFWAACLPAQGQGVYIAGQGFTLEQALEQALAEQQGGQAFWIVAAGREARRVLDPEAAAVLRAAARGGTIFVCETDLPPGARLPPGLVLVRADTDGPFPQLAGDTDAEPPPATLQNRLILRTCAPP